MNEKEINDTKMFLEWIANRILTEELPTRLAHKTSTLNITIKIERHDEQR